MNRTIPWTWTESLGGLRPNPDRFFKVRTIIFGLVRDRCHDLGLLEGQEIRCIDRTPERVVFQRADGLRQELELPYAWFIEVEAVDGKDIRTPRFRDEPAHLRARLA